MVYVNLWSPSIVCDVPHGVIHLDCQFVRNPPRPYKWRTAESVEAAERLFADRTLFFCGMTRCFGPNHPRRAPRRTAST